MSDSQKPIGYWRSMSPKYNDLNAKLRGLPSAILASTESAKPADPQQPQPKSFLDKATTFAEGLYGPASFGLADVIGKKLFPQVQQEVEERRVRNPGANLAGNVAGVAATLPLELGAGLGRAVQAGVQGAKAAPGLLAKLAGGAAGAAPTALSQAAVEVAKTGGNIGQAAKNLGLSLLGGGIGGAVIGGIASKLPRAQKATRDVLNELILKAGGTRGKSVVETLKGGIAGKAGFTPERANQLKDEIVSAITKKGLYGKQALMEFIEDGGEVWKKVDEAWNKSGAKVSDFRQQVMNDPQVMEALTMPGVDPVAGVAYADHAKKVFEDIFARVGAKEGLPGIRKVLMDNMKNAWKESSTLGNITGDINGALRDAIDMQFIPPGLKAEYPALLALKKSLAWAETQMARDTGGSATAPRQMVKQMLGGAGGGAGIGAIAGGQKFDPKDPSTWLPAAGIMAGSTLGGAVANRALAAGQRQILGRLASVVRRAVPAGVSPAISQIAGAAPQIGAKAAQAIGTIPQGETATAPESVSAVPVPEPQIPKTIAKGTPEAIQQKEGSLDEGAVDEARGKTLAGYEQRIQDIIESEYKTNLEPYGVEYQDFLKGVMAIIGDGKGGIDPKRAAPALFPDKDQRTKFLRDYDKALALQGIDVGSAIGYETPGLFGSRSPIESEKSYQDLIGLLSNLAPTVDKSSDKQRDAQVRQDIATIKKMAGGAAQKKAMIEELIQNRYGVDLAQLKGLGLYA